MDDLNINSFNALYTLYYRKSFLFAKPYVHDEQAAEDIAADNPEIIFAIRCTKDKDDYGWNSIGGFYANIDGVGWGELYASEPRYGRISQRVYLHRIFLRRQSAQKVLPLE